MDQDPLSTSLKSGGPHHLLGELTGRWQGLARTWFQPGELADESPVDGEIRTWLDGRFVLHQYQGTLLGEPLEGIAMYGYNLGRERFEVAWIDNRHMGTGMMFSTGLGIDNGFSVLGSYEAPGEGPPWGWRTEIVLQDGDHLMVTMYNITPQGEEATAVVFDYHRKR